MRGEHLGAGFLENPHAMKNTQAGAEVFDKSCLDPRLKIHTVAKMLRYTHVSLGRAVEGWGVGNLPRGEGIWSLGVQQT